MPDLASDLIDNEFVVALLVAAVAWPVLASMSTFLLLRVLNRQRLSEFPRVLVKSGSGFLLAVLLLTAMPHIDDALGPSLGAGPLQAVVVGTVIVLLRFMSGLFLWSSWHRVRRLAHREFIQPKYRAFGHERERNTADVINRIVTILGGTLVLVYLAWLFHLNLPGYLVAFGGASVALAFGLQSILKNVLAGVSLALEVPFSTNDLIRIGDDRIYQILHRGLDITTVRDIGTHETVYLPNALLAESVLRDITRPTDDLRLVIDVGVPYGVDLRHVREIMTDIANGHPSIIGSFPVKRDAIARKVTRLYLRGVFGEVVQHFAELGRIEAEDSLNEALVTLTQRLENWAAFIDRVEARGFDHPERKYLDAIADELEEKAARITRLTTRWQIMVRNSSASARLNLRVRESPNLVAGGAPRFRSIKPPAGSGLRIVADSAGWPVREGVEDRELLNELTLRATRRMREDINTLSQGSDEGARRFRAAHESWLEQHTDKPLQIDENGMDEFQDLWGRLRGLRGELESLSERIGPLVSSRSSEGFGDLHPADAEAQSTIPPALLDEARYEEVRAGLRSEFGQEPDELKPRVISFSTGLDAGWSSGRWDLGELGGYIDASFKVHAALSAMESLSAVWAVQPENLRNHQVYRELEGDFEAVNSMVNELGSAYGSLIKGFSASLWGTEWVSGDSFTIAECKTRSEDSYLSTGAVEHILDHPLCEAIAGAIVDDDARHDLADLFAVWGDKTHQLLGSAAGIASRLRRGASTVIDTELRELAQWLKESFKDPFPAWKYPVASVESYDDSSIGLAVKFYVDNVRMEKYQRPFATSTQFRQRLIERLENAGIEIPFPQRDIHIKPEQST